MNACMSQMNQCYSGIYQMFKINNIFRGLYLLLFISVQSISSNHDCFIATIRLLKNADCKGFNLKTIPTSLERDIKQLRFENNQLTFLKQNEFKRYPLLQNIYLMENRINIIPPDAFKGLLNLQILDLENNKLKEIPQDAFAHIKSLRILNIENNQIRHINNESLSSLINLEELNLENNYITTIETHAFMKLPKLVELNIANNDLERLSSEFNKTLPKNLTFIHLQGNPWECDCHLRWFLEFLQFQPSRKEISWQFSEKTPHCKGPPLIKGATWKQLSLDQFTCPSQIHVKQNSTKIKALPGKNVSIDCFIQGDPKPNVTWKKNEGIIPQKIEIKEVISKQREDLFVTSTITLFNVREYDIGDYKCIAQNNGGRSEVTYSLYIEGVALPKPPGKKIFIFGLSKEVFLAIIISAGMVIILFFVVIIFCLVWKQNRQKHAYKVREYQRPPNNINMKTSQETRVNVQEMSHPLYQKPQRTERNIDSIPDTKHLLGEKKETLDNKEHFDIKREDSSKSLNQQDKIQSENEFKMKIFASYDDEEGEQQTEVTKPTTAIIERQEDVYNEPESSSRIRPIKSPERETPDLLKDRIIINRAIPVPPPLVPNHVTSVHPRAKENPYVTASELKAVNMKRKTASADDLLDSRDDFVESSTPQVVKRSSSRDDVNLTNKYPHANNFNIKKTRFKEPLIRIKDHASTCKNPVCLKDQLGLMDPNKEPLYSKPHKPIINLRPKDGNREIDVDDMSSPDPKYDYNDIYRTMPARISKSHRDAAYKHHSPPGTTQSSPAKSPVSNRYGKPANKRGYVPTKTVSFSEEGHPIIDLTQEMPEPIVITSCDSDDSTLKKSYKPYPHYSSTLPRIPQQNIHHKSPLPNGSPPGKSARTLQCTTLDDLLSPPFGQSPKSQRHNRQQGSQTLPHKRILKPGEKDEFGTAV